MLKTKKRVEGVPELVGCEVAALDSRMNSVVNRPTKVHFRNPFNNLSPVKLAEQVVVCLFHPAPFNGEVEGPRKRPIGAAGAQSRPAPSATLPTLTDPSND